jgi:beta-lactamase superfamily II metal-dependent hydrolase
VLNRFLEYDPGYVAPCKFALEVLGYAAGRVRAPLPALTQAEQEAVRAALAQLGYYTSSPSTAAAGATPSVVNNNFIALRLVYGRISFLLPDDVEEEAETVLLFSDESLACTILKSPYHGSDTALNPRFLEAVNP